ncbi:MAG TPA: DUF3574 domain-containing protein [Rhizomicrobium sp.]|jgi:hypothetical protein|nr:DUF3574 domain-containing protein [Rhizomicrobium sp.]
MTRLWGILALLTLTGCAPAASRCLVDSQAPMTVVELFFGRDIPGRAPLSDGEWSDFASTVVAKEFPEGFTVTDGEGEWRDPATHAVIREHTKILIVAAPRSADLAFRISRIRHAYSVAYQQTSVGVLTYDACGEF